MAISKLTEKDSVESVKSAARFVITQQETVDGQSVESVRRAGLGVTVDALRSAGINKGRATDATVGYIEYSELELRPGNIATSTGKWANVSSANYKHVIIAVDAGATVDITTSTGYSTVYAWLTSDDAPAQSASAPLCSGTSATQLAKNKNTVLTAPDTAKWFYLFVRNNGNDVSPAALSVNGIDVMKSVAENIKANQDATGAVETRATALEGRAEAAASTLGYDAFGAITQRRGIIAPSTGKWSSTTSSSNTHVLIAVNAGENVKITAPESYSTYYAWLTSDSAPVQNDSAPLCDGCSATQLAAAQTAEITAPDSAKWLYVVALSSSNDVTPALLEIGGVSYLDSVAGNLKKQQAAEAADIAALDARTDALEAYADSADARIGYRFPADIARRPGSIVASTGKWGNVSNDNFKHILIPASPGDVFSGTAPSAYNTFFAWLTSNDAPVQGDAAPLCTGYSATQIPAGTTRSGTAPSGANWLYILTLNGGNDSLPVAMSLNGVNLFKNIFDNIKANGEGVLTRATEISALDARVAALEGTAAVKWCAMGDSITQGFYSCIEDGEATSHTNRTITWPYRLARAKGWTLTNIAVGGTGYIDPANGATPGDPSSEKRGWQVAAATDFSTYDLITVAYGINDYKADVPLGELNGDDLSAPTTIYGGIQATITNIKATAPSSAKIILFTPLNARGYNDELGTYAEDYAIGYEESHAGTLKDVRDAIIECAEYYGIDYIDQMYSGVVNALALHDGLDSVAPDGVHPSLGAHSLLAEEIGQKIKYNGDKWDIVNTIGVDGFLAREIWKLTVAE